MADNSKNSRKFRTSNAFRGKRKRCYGKKKYGKAESGNIEPIQIDLTERNDVNENVSGEIDIATDLQADVNLANHIQNFISSSEEKINSLKSNEINSEVDGNNCIIIEVSAISALFSAAACPQCKTCKLQITENSNRKGLVSVLSLTCTNSTCTTFDTALKKVYSSSKIGLNKNYDNPDDAFNLGRGGGGGSSKVAFSTNLKVVLASRAVGIGHNQLERFCAIMGLPKPLHHKSFFSLAKKLHAATKIAVAKNMVEVRKKVIEKNGNKNIACMFDGTWQKRGHKSHNGIGVLIEIETGYCIDHEILSNYCKVCLKSPKDDDDLYQEWMDKHAPNCQKNIDCTANAMEKEAALRIWQRSEKQDPPLLYTTFLSDGDSKAFQAVSDSKVYGERAEVVKEDCTNHVSKRLGTALRKLKMPRGHALDDSKIKRLQLYYTMAITNNRGNVVEMYKAIWASYFHSTSTDAEQAHKFCTPGKYSWCKWKAAEANEDINVPNHNPRISRPQAKEMLPVYKRLTDADLLQRCSKGKTQNAAESLNSKIWTLCPKSRYATKTSVETAAGLAILWFNKGSAGFYDVLMELKITPSHHYHIQASKADCSRISTMKKRMTGEFKGRRKRQKLVDAKKNERLAAEEGQTYFPGGF